MAIYYGEGEYPAIIVSHTFSAGQYGTQLVIEIEPQSSGNTNKRTAYLGFLDGDGKTDKNIEKTLAFLRSIGYCDDPSRLDANSPNPASLIGTEVTAFCRHNVKDDKEKWYLNAPKEAVDRKVLSKLDSLFGKQLKNQAPATCPKPSPTAKARNALTDTKPKDIDAANNELADAVGDDIPF
jgi:hypothetical protein